MAVVAVTSPSPILPSFRNRFSTPVANAQAAGFESATPARCETATSSAIHSRLPGSSRNEYSIVLTVFPSPSSGAIRSTWS